MLQSPHRRHAHKRSAAISGDFDLEFFRAGATSSMPEPITPPITPVPHFTSKPPQVVITESGDEGLRTPSPRLQQHARVNSWAHSMGKNKSKDKYEYEDNGYASPDVPTLHYSLVPEAIIDLDLAAGVYYDPVTNVRNTKIHHRRTESAPELEDFFKTQDARMNSAIFEEDEEEENSNIKKSSTGSLHSQTSLKFNSSSTPQSSRRGASATRYQSYYQNNILLANALKSSESLDRAVYKGTKTPLSSASSSSLTVNSPARFKFQSRAYDMPSDGDDDNELQLSPKRGPAHKKSKSLLASLSQKMRRYSVSSREDLTLNDDTIIHENFGEPGPILDLTKAPKEQEQKKKRGFFHWMRR